MRREDWNAALAIRNFWNDPTKESPPECPLFTSIDHLLAGMRVDWCGLRLNAAPRSC